MNIANLMYRIRLAPVEPETGGGANTDNEAASLYSEAQHGTAPEGGGAERTEETTSEEPEPKLRESREERAMRLLEEQEARDAQTDEQTSDETEEDDESEDEGEDDNKGRVLKLDPESISALRAAVGAGQQQTTPQYSPEQLRQMLNPIELKPEFVARMFDGATPPEERLAMLMQFAQGIVKNATSIGRLQLEQKERQFRDALTPLEAYRQETQLTQSRNEFYKANPEFKKYPQLVKAAAVDVQPTKLVNGKAVDKTKEEIFGEVGRNVRATLKSLGITPASPGTVAKSGGANGLRSTSAVPKANTMSTTGRSGGESSAVKGKVNNPDADIYGGR